MSIAESLSHPLGVLLGTFGFLSLYYLVSGIISYCRLSHIPGPFVWSWTRLPLIRTHIKGDSYEKFGWLAESYGKLVRIGPNYLLTSDPDIVRRMNATRSPYVRSNWYLASRLTPGVDNMISDRDDHRHDILRKKAGLAYSGKENHHLEQDIDECVIDFTHLIETKYITRDDQPVKMEFARKAQFFTTDVISLLSFREKFNNLRNDKDTHGFITEIETLFPSVFCMSVFPEIIDFLTTTGIFQWLNPADNPRLAFGRVFAIIKKKVDSRLDSQGNFKESHDMMGSFIKHGMTRQELEQETMLQLLAAMDTTGTAIRATMLCLMKNEKACKKLVGEIDQAIKDGKVPRSMDKVIQGSEAKQLPYLQAVINEGLRWLPPSGGLLPKLVPEGGDTIEGYFVPGGTILGYSSYAVHHSTDIFGADPFAFRPERWLHTSEGGDEPSWEAIKLRERTNDLIFGYGKYQCLGKKVALLELNKIFVELLRRFEFTLLDPDNPWESRCYGVHVQKGLWVTVRRRANRKE